MKKILLFVAVLAVNITASAQKDKHLLAKVKKVNGVETYIMNEPLREYETVVDVATGAKAESLLTGGLVNKSIAGRIEQFIKRAKKENENIDAIIYTSGKSIVAVKFTDKGSASTTGMAKVTKVKGLPCFVMCEPVSEYDVLRSEGGGVKWKSLVTAGIVNNGIDEDVQKICDKLDGVRGVEAFYLDGSKEGQAIKFGK